MDQIDSDIIVLLELAKNGDVDRFQEEMVNYRRLDVRAGAQVVGYKDRTPLHLAAMNGREGIVNLIMTSPNISIEVVNARDRYGLSPLHLAIRSGHARIVRIFTTSLYLLPDRFTAAMSKTGPDVDERERDKLERDCEGFTPLHFAAWTGKETIVKLVLRQLCQVGTGYDPVNIHATTWEGNTPLDIAKERHHEGTVDLLECFDVNWLQAERERSASSMNAILVGDTLVVALTFGCWLQPPLGIPDMDARNNALGSPHLDPHLRTKHQTWFFASVAFSLAFSMIGLVIGTLAIIPSRHASLKREVHHLRRLVQTTSIFLFMAILFLAQAAHYAGLLVFRTVAFADGVASTAGDWIVRIVSGLCILCIFAIVTLMGQYGRWTRGVIVVSVLVIVGVHVVEVSFTKCFLHQC